MAFRVLADKDEVQANGTYRSTYFMTGPFPPEYVRYNFSRLAMASAHLRGKIEIKSHEWFDRGFASYLPGAPYNTWALRVQWKKIGSGTPLVFFTGPTGILTLAIIATIVAVAGFVIVLHYTEEFFDELLDKPGDWILLAAALGITWLVTMRRN